MKLQKFDELYNKIINECVKTKKRSEYKSFATLLPGHLFAPKVPFEITDDMYISGAICKNKTSWAGIVKEILSNNELIYEITGNYSERMVPTFDEKMPYAMQGYNAFRGPSTTIRYKLIPGETYYICDKDLPAYETGKWCEVIYQMTEPNKNIETEDGEGAGDVGGAGITTNSVFGCDGSAFDSLVHGDKDPNGPGITTHDLKAMYTLSLNPKRSKKKYPIFKRKKL